jgi:predicted Rossmann-fold nucleotide-binding protein
LSIHNKPILLLNTAGYYTDLFQMMQTMQRSGFLWDKLEDRVQVFDVPEKLVEALDLLFGQIINPQPTTHNRQLTTRNRQPTIDNSPKT